MTIMSDPNLWVICALVFLLGLLVGVLLTAGGRKKWRTRYHSEVERRRDLERTYEEREKHWLSREREWGERDTVRGSTVRGRRGSSSRDVDGDGVSDDVDRRPTDDRRA
jgi:hypothetical protein